MSDRVAFIGTGIMGGPMAGHLLAAGLPLIVHTRTRARAQDLLARGAAWAGSPRDAAAGADVVFICVPDTPDVEAVIEGDGGVLAAARSGLIIVDHSTISPAATRRLAALLAERGAALLDAPVSGGDVGARNATLSIMVGGDEVAFERVRPLLAHTGKTITHCGPSGTGQLTKLVNQILVSVTNLAVSEALVFAKHNGLDPARTIAALAGGAAGSWQLANLGPRMVAGDFAPGFTIDLQVKDLNLVQGAADASRLWLAGVRQAHALFRDGQSHGRGKDGTQALYALVEDQAQHFFRIVQESLEREAGGEAREVSG